MAWSKGHGAGKPENEGTRVRLDEGTMARGGEGVMVESVGSNQ